MILEWNDKFKLMLKRIKNGPDYLISRLQPNLLICVESLWSHSLDINLT